MPTEVYVAGLLHSVLILLQCQAYTKLSWEDEAAPTVSDYAQYNAHNPYQQEQQQPPGFQQQQQPEQQTYYAQDENEYLTGPPPKDDDWIIHSDQQPGWEDRF